MVFELSIVRPYLYGAYELPEFLAVFGAREIERREASERRAAHVELAISDSAVVVEAGELPPEHVPTESSATVYVEDVDAVCRLAVDAGTESIAVIDSIHALRLLFLGDLRRQSPYPR